MYATIQYKLYEFDTSCSLKHDKFNPQDFSIC